MTTQTYNRNTIVALLLTGGFISILNQTTMITAIPPIMDEMGISANTGQWLTTVFMLVNGVMIPVTAFLMERFSTRQLFISAMSIFAFGTLIAGFAPNFSILLLGRIIQSSGAGITMPLMQTVLLLIYPVHKRGAAMGLVGLVIQFAPAIGPTLSGWMINAYSWRVMFFVIFPIALLLIGAAWRFMQNVTDLTRPKVDIFSIILSSVGFGGLLYGFTSAGNFGWGSRLTIITLIIGVMALVLFIVRQLRLLQPMLEFRVFKYGMFTLTTGIGMLAFMGLIGIETLLPLYMQNMQSFSAMESGLAIFPGALIMGLMSPITGRVFDKIGAKWLVITGLSIMALTTFPFAALTTSTSFAYLTIYYSIRMFGLSMVMMPVTTAGLNQLPDRLIAHGTAMNNTMRQVSASIGTAIFVTVMTTTGESAKQDPTVAHPMILGVNIAFVVITILSVAAVILAFFIKKTSPPEEEKSVGGEIGES